ncbi:cysteine peptidase family C39 domain-containing protein [Aquiflexum sp.]|uniref:cysteine peptidase family C39 domain-containing protein n=1 Tax=Aquiflexum sp. TaxID=1872584 RepID=UPI003593C37B
MGNSYLILKRILHLLDIPFTNNYLKETLDSHPEPESLLSISDTLAKYKIESLAVKINEEKLDQIPLPCIVQLQGDSYPYFSCISGISEESVEFTDVEGKNKNLSKNEFVNKWTGITLLLEKLENALEPGYSTRRKENLIFQTLLILFGIIGVVWLMDITLGLSGGLSHTIGALLFFALKLIGLVLSSILLWSEVDKDNSTIKEFCTGGKNIDCNAVTNSFSLGGGINLIIVAFAYFFSGIFHLALSSFSGPVLQLFSYLSLSGIVIVPISIYYQWAKIKKWCVLCLWISAVLVLEVLVSQLLLVNLGSIGFQDLALFSLLFTGSVLAWLSSKPYLLAKNELQKQKSKLARFMSNREVFDYLLSSSRKLTHSPEGLGIFMKGQSPKFHVLKVCNPYCGPCAKTHPVLEELYKTGNIDLQIIFLAGGKDEVKLKTVSHLMAIAAKDNPEVTKKALDDWYFAEKKDYAAFAAKYPLNGELKAQDANLQSMLSWSEVENITYTPTIFINGHELPKAYAVEDLKYVLE